LLSYPAHNKNEEYVNSLYQQFSGEQKVQVGDKVSYSVAAVETTTKGTNDKPFYFDGKTTWELGTTQKQFTGGWSDTATGYKVNDNIFRTFNFGVGSYVDYYVNTSRNGSLSGDVTFSDILPEGLEIQYLRNADFKASYEGYTKNVVIPELEEEIAKNPDTPWKKYSEYEKAYCESTTKYCYYYYNTETREVRWKLSDVKTKPNEGSNVKEISFQLICKIVDKDVLRGVKEGNFDNTVVVSQDGRVVDEASTQLRVEAESVAKSLDKDATTVTSSNGNNVVTGNKVTFKLEVNRFNEDFSSKMKSLTVIDKMCSSFTLLPETVKFTYNDGTELDKDLTKTVIEIKDDGETYMTFTVPSSQEVIITYSAKINADEEEVISSVSNEAEWKTEVSLIPSKWSMSNFSFKFGAGVKIAEKPSLKILKSDLDDATKALSGATFSVQEVAIDSDGNITTVGDAHTGTTDENGELTFSTEDGDKWFSRNTIYAITETAAPDGYNAADTKYILVTTKGSTRTYDSRVEVIRGVAEVCEVEIYDEPIKIGYVLPSAGGLGTYPIKAVGAVLITAGTASYVCVRRRKKRQNR
jgi:hypothetical protein